MNEYRKKRGIMVSISANVTVGECPMVIPSKDKEEKKDKV